VNDFYSLLLTALLLTLSYVIGEAYWGTGKKNKIRRKADWEAQWWAMTRFPFSMIPSRAKAFADKHWEKYGALIQEEEAQAVRK
jgi:hypothetical protein